jgi:hypothetical protein
MPYKTGFPFAILALIIMALAHARRSPIRNDAFGGSTKKVTTSASSNTNSGKIPNVKRRD